MSDLINPAPFASSQDWGNIAPMEIGVQSEIITGALCLAEGLEANAFENFFEEIFPDGEESILPFFPVTLLVPSLANFDLNIWRRESGFRVFFNEVVPGGHQFTALFSADTDGRIDDLLVCAWAILEKKYPAVLVWRALVKKGKIQ